MLFGWKGKAQIVDCVDGWRKRELDVLKMAIPVKDALILSFMYVFFLC